MKNIQYDQTLLIINNVACLHYSNFLNWAHHHHPSNIIHDHFESNPLGHVCARVVVVHVTRPLEISTRISTSRELSRLLGMLNFATTREARYDAGDAWFPLAVLSFITKCTGSSHRHSAQHESSGPKHSEDSPDRLPPVSNPCELWPPTSWRCCARSWRSRHLSAPCTRLVGTHKAADQARTEGPERISSTTPHMVFGCSRMRPRKRLPPKKKCPRSLLSKPRRQPWLSSTFHRRCSVNWQV